MASFKDVKVGDKFILSNGDYERVVSVIKVTSTRFECGGSTFLKADGKVHGEGSYSRTFLSILDDEAIKRMQEKVRKEKIVKTLNNVNFSKFSIEKLEQVLNALGIEVKNV